MALLVQTVQGGPAVNLGGGDGLNLLSLRPAGWGGATPTTVKLLDFSDTPPGAPFDSDRAIGTTGFSTIFHSLNGSTTNWTKGTGTNPVSGNNYWDGVMPAGSYGILNDNGGYGLGNFFHFPPSVTKIYMAVVFEIITSLADGEAPTGWVHPTSNKWFGLETAAGAGRAQVFCQLYEGGYYVRAEEESSGGFFIPPTSGQVNNNALVKSTIYNMEQHVDLTTGTYKVNVNGSARVNATGLPFESDTIDEANIRVYRGGGGSGTLSTSITYRMYHFRVEYPS